MSSGDSAFEPFLEYSGRSSSPTPSLSPTSSAVRIVEPNQVAEQNPEPYVELNTIRSEPSEHGPKSSFPPDQSRHPLQSSNTRHAADAERVALPPRADSSIRAARTTHRHAHLPSLLLPGEGRYAFYARKQTKLLTGAPTSDKGWKDRYFFVKRGHWSVSPSELGIRSVWAERVRPSKQKNQEASPSQQQHKLQPEPIPEGIPLPFIEVPYTHVLEGCIRLLYGEPTDPLWASYPIVDMGKMKVAAPTAEQLAEKERKRKEKKAARRARGSRPNKQFEPTPSGTITVQPKDLRVAAVADKSPPYKKQRHSSPPAATKGKEPLAPQANLGLEDSSSIRSDSNLIAPIVDCLMTRHDKSILKSMPLEDICHEAEQGALKLAQTSRYLDEAVVKVDSAFKKKAAAHSSVVATNKILEADIFEFKQAAIDANDRAEEAEKKWSEAGQKLSKREAGILDWISHEMILKFKAGQTSWPTPEPSEDEGDDGETSEISSNESEPEHVGQQEDLLAVQEGSSSPTRDSFIEAMEAARTDTQEPNSNMEEVVSVPQPSREDHP
ncbi:hypothetical protein FNV43_RR21502 [Rhamnella rubrinervis]|uniref:Uncharacterized protein n=1 Tax=Rhamnella rubrinervis TaxID=2594499 RepID=A0A8K0E2E1_9ROSA|nr:hypothetical protein FNV43_RR21502 [Rhamnella rubrinervis]